MEMKISVRNLIEFVHRHGDIVSGGLGTSPKRMEEGTKAHVKIQKQRQKEEASYEKERYLSYGLSLPEGMFLVDGRADGMVPKSYIEEIKSTYLPLAEITDEYAFLHWAQVMFYGFMHMKEEDLAELRLILTYYHLEHETERSLEKNVTLQEMETFVHGTIETYMAYVREDLAWKEKRNASLKELPFPFSSYRKGQRELAVDVYRTIRQGGKLFAKAPTGIGKTVSTLFPSVKALAEGEADKIFYLTAKGPLKAVAEETMALLEKRTAQVKFLTLTSKEKICVKEEVHCHPEYCERAKGHYDRINDCILEILREERTYHKEMILAYAERYQVCPFELSLDLSYFSDVIICDYNYVFDPRVYLKRFFTDIRENYLFLVDEAHNLVDRARDMYSAELSKEEILTAKKLAKPYKYLHRPLSKLNDYFITLRKELEEAQGRRNYFGVSEDLIFLLKDFLQGFEIFQKEVQEDVEGRDVLTNVFFAIHGFLNISELYTEGYVTYEEKVGQDVRLKLFCVDPREILVEVFKRAKASILFSATLSPMRYYVDVLGGEEGDFRRTLSSPFQKEHLSVYLDERVDTRYHKRQESLEQIAKNLVDLVQQKEGNYIAFFPSYKYMRDVFEVYEAMGEHDHEHYLQEPNLSEEEREAVLALFYKKRSGSFLAFMVLGGIFSEGIDLQGDALIGAAIIGVGYPQVSYERDLIKDYFSQEDCGFEYAYIYPGMNRVLQAAGRVIRSEEDEGAVLLMDLRYNWKQYESLLPEEWKPLGSWAKKP